MNSVVEKLDQTSFQSCAHCKRIPKQGQVFLCCSACKVPQITNCTSYCSNECQKADWPSHKETCKSRRQHLEKLTNTDEENAVDALQSALQLWVMERIRLLTLLFQLTIKEKNTWSDRFLILDIDSARKGVGFALSVHASHSVWINSFVGSELWKTITQNNIIAEKKGKKQGYVYTVTSIDNKTINLMQNITLVDATLGLPAGVDAESVLEMLKDGKTDDDARDIISSF